MTRLEIVSELKVEYADWKTWRSADLELVLVEIDLERPRF